MCAGFSCFTQFFNTLHCSMTQKHKFTPTEANKLCVSQDLDTCVYLFQRLAPIPWYCNAYGYNNCATRDSLLRAYTQGLDIMPIHDMLCTDHWYIVLLGPVKVCVIVCMRICVCRQHLAYACVLALYDENKLGPQIITPKLNFKLCTISSRRKRS